MSVISSGHLLFKIALSEGTERIEKFMTEHTITDEYAQHLVQITYTHTINPDHYLICIDLLQRQK
jgi:GTP-sensing pleiotropic transcriptional regulator CodY